MLENILKKRKQIGRGILLKGLIYFSPLFYNSCEKEEIRALDLDTPKTIVLTFDDGPDKKYTPLILDILKQENVKATFFLVGKNIKKHPDITKRIFQEGHFIGNHTTDHSNITKKSFKEIYNNILITEKLIDSLYGGSQKYFRPPWGLITQEQRDSLSKYNFKVTLWDINSKDWSVKYNSNMIISKVLSEVHNESKNKIILFHSADYSLKNSRINTVKALPKIISTLKKEGYVFKKIDKLD